MTFEVQTVDISEDRKLYLYTFNQDGQETGDEEKPKVS